jgi:two-component system sensor histidine kinase CiaH
VKTNSPAKKQRLLLFISELVSFTVIFLILGLVIFYLFRSNVYRNIDKTLDQEEAMVLHPPSKTEPLQPLPQNRRRQPPMLASQPFKSIQLTYNAQGKIVNDHNLGQRNYEYLKNLKLNKQQVDQKQTLQTNGGTFRTLLVQLPKSSERYANAGRYVLILQNIDGELQSVSAFVKALVITIAIFWLLALGFSYGLSYWSMQPILKAWQRQREFTADAAHELRAPLAVIQSQQEYLLTKPDQKVLEVADEVAETLSEIKRLQTLTDNLLLLARTDAEQLALEQQPVTDMTWLESLGKTYQEIATSQQKSFTYEIQTQVDLNIDVKLIKQLVIILLNNALQYTQSHESIWLTAEHYDNYFRIEVGDSGLDIADKDKPLIFQRFYRADAARNKYTGGNGLGLTIAQWIVKQHHGSIKVRNVHPKGASFVISLPWGKLNRPKR